MPIRRLALLALLFAAPVCAAPLRATTPAATPAAAPMLGVSWYPEQWPEARWDTDLALMEQAGVRFVRVGEFAWSTMEPQEGTYRFDWLERAIRAAQRHHIQVVLGTPTAAPPAWLTSTYPETLRTLPDGSRATHGGRHQADYLNPKFRDLARALITQMAQRFGHDPDVIGWQIDNEIGTDDRSPDSRARFQSWLKQRYGTLDALNTAWSTTYWSQTYQDWSQIPFPAATDGNPGLMLAYRQFVSAAYRDYVSDQVAVLRAHVDPRQRATTNYWIDAREKAPAAFSPDMDDLDLYTVSRDLDFVSWDAYVGSGHLDPVRFGLTHDIVRGVLGRNFWVMETQPGTVNWSALNSSLAPGEVRAMAWSAVGHGADAIGYWQWRSAPGGQEQYHGTLLGADGTPVPVYDEIKRLGQDFARAAPVLSGSNVVAQVAMLNDYPSRWAIGWQRFNDAYSPADAMAAYYTPLHATARAVDVVADTAALGRYRLVVAPALNVLTAQAAANLIAYVKGGGHLVLGDRSGMKDGDNKLHPQRQPGPLAEVLGARVAQWYALDQAVPVAGSWGNGTAALWAERLEVTAPDTQVTLRYGPGNGWLEGQAAAVTRKLGRGSITYVGANLNAALTRTIIDRLEAESGVAPVLPEAPAQVDVGLREGPKGRLLILTNFASTAQAVKLPHPMGDQLGGGEVKDLTLPPYGVAVLTDSASPRHMP